MLPIIFEPDELQELDLSTLKLESSSVTDLAVANRRGDLVFSIALKSGEVRAKLMLLLEHKSGRKPKLMQQMLARL